MICFGQANKGKKIRKIKRIDSYYLLAIKRKINVKDSENGITRTAS